MAQLVVRKLDDDVKAKLQRRAGQNARCTEEEVPASLHHSVEDDVRGSGPLGRRLSALFAGIGLDQDIPERRGHPAQPAEFR